MKTMTNQVLSIALICAGAVLLGGCTKTERTIAGVAIGAGTGGLIGGLAGGPVGGAVGAVSGGIVGGVIGNKTY